VIVHRLPGIHGQAGREGDGGTRQVGKAVDRDTAEEQAVVTGFRTEPARYLT